MNNKRILFLLFLLILSTFVALTNNYKVTLDCLSKKTEQSNEFTDIDYLVSRLEGVRQFCYDNDSGGYFSSVNDAKTVIYDAKKSIGDYMELAETYLSLANITSNSTYIFKAEELLEFIELFRLENGIYVTFLANDWTLHIESPARITTHAKLGDLYLLFYQYTKQSSYLEDAMRCYNIIEQKFKDKQDGGYNFVLNPITLTYEADHHRITGYYSYYIDFLYNLGKITNNGTYITKAQDMSNNIIQIAWNDSYGCFWPRIYNNNTVNTIFSTFYLHEQVPIARTLLKLSIHFKDEYYKQKALSIMNKTFEEAYNIVDEKFVHSVWLWGDIYRDTYFATRQVIVSHFLLDMQMYDYKLTTSQLTILNNSLDVLEDFIGAQSGLFVRTVEESNVVPWVNADILTFIIRFIKSKTSDAIIFRSSDTEEQVIFSLLNFTPGFDLIILVVSLLGVKSFRYFTKNQRYSD